MSYQTKKEYLKILLNVKNNKYQNDEKLLLIDLLKLKRLLLLDSEDTRLALTYSALSNYYQKTYKKVLTK